MTLKELRKKIDAVDTEILRLFEARQELSEQVGICKREEGLPVLDETRQAEKLAELCEKAAPQNRAAAEQLFTELMALSRTRQEGKL